MEETLYNTIFTSAPLIASFLAGILTFLSPCILPLIPAYVSYISGISLEDLRANLPHHRVSIVLKTLSFILGFCSVFVILGVFFGSVVGRWLQSTIFSYIAGGIVIAFGLHFLGIFRIRFLYKVSPKLSFAHLESLPFVSPFLAFLAPFLLGVSFSACWTPCAGPILGAILALAALKNDMALWYMLSYAGGLGLAFLLTSLIVERALELFARLKAFMRIIEIACGILLIGIGVLIMQGKLDSLGFDSLVV
ncbi:cytochrome c biogenesis protein CcdA [uncultured Helicobacter sp.]|uniref:cytochrome c biogenesis protein CcdA n=1 Tax=uncultured Helicobacter sp. TaxID=175537 RepID=UPI001C3C0397|nr:cytochrome c biogenesis protein CcdA [Candidatus Helicobacter avicola]